MLEMFILQRKRVCWRFHID